MLQVIVRRRLVVSTASLCFSDGAFGASLPLGSRTHSFLPFSNRTAIPKPRDDAIRRPLRLLVRALDSWKVRGGRGAYIHIPILVSWHITFTWCSVVRLCQCCNVFASSRPPSRGKCRDDGFGARRTRLPRPPLHLLTYVQYSLLIARNL